MKSLEGKIDKNTKKLLAGFVASIGVALVGTSMIAKDLGDMVYYSGKGKPLLYTGGTMFLASVPIAAYCVKKLHDLLGNNVNDSCTGK